MVGARARPSPPHGPTGLLDLPGRPDQTTVCLSGHPRLCLAMADCT